MSPRKQRPARPIESVLLRVAFQTDKTTATKIKEAVPSAKSRIRGIEIVIEGENPSEVAEKAKGIFEKIKSIEA